MNLPLIINRNMKNTAQKSSSQNKGMMSGDQFGLGIQVFKIQSNKAIIGQKNKNRNMMKNLQNPIPTKPTYCENIKKPQTLPRLSVEKKSRTAGQIEVPKPRKQTVEKVAPYGSLSKEPPRKKQEKINKTVLDKKVSGVTPSLPKHKSQPVLATTKEKVKFHEHYRSEMQQLANFYQQYQEVETDYQKQAKKIKKMKENENPIGTVQLKYYQNSEQSEIIKRMVEIEPLQAFQSNEEYDQFDLQIYLETGGNFKNYQTELKQQEILSDSDQQ